MSTRVHFLLTTALARRMDTTFREIFRLKHDPSTSNAHQILGHVSDLFVAYLASNVAELDPLCCILKNTHDTITLKWLPEYSCVLMGTKNHHLSRISMQLIILDGWKCDVEAAHASKRMQVGKSWSDTSFNVGDVHSSLYDEFLTSFNEALERCEEKKKDSYFIHQTLNKILRPTRPSDPSRGLCSQVGVNRGVAWHLVLAASCVLIETYPNILLCSSDLNRFAFCKRLEIDFYLWILEEKVGRPSYISIKRIDFIMAALTVVCTESSSLTESGSDTSEFEIRCRGIRSNLISDVDRMINKYSASYCLGKICSYAFAKTDDCDKSDLADLTVTLPPPATESKGVLGSLLASRDRASLSLGSLFPAPCITCSTLEMLTWMGKIGAKTSTNSSQCPVSEGRLLVMSTVEQWLFTWLGDIDHSNPRQCISSELEILLENYRQVCNSFKASDDSRALMSVELRSLEVLSTWIIFCIIHDTAVKAHPILKKYGVPLDWRDVRHLVLSSKAAEDAALLVSRYLERNTITGRAVFSLSAEDRTFDMAVEFALDNTSIMAKWKAEKETAARKQADNWTTIRRRQAEAAELREDIITLGSELHPLKAELAKYEYSNRIAGSTVVSTSLLRSSINHLEQKIRSKTSSLRSAEEPLPAIIQPLPKGETAAMRILFFLYMPDVVRSFSTMCMVAQQMLLPSPAFTHTLEGESHLIFLQHSSPVIHNL